MYKNAQVTKPIVPSWNNYLLTVDSSSQIQNGMLGTQWTTKMDINPVLLDILA